jgi:hypothetical protein
LEWKKSSLNFPRRLGFHEKEGIQAAGEAFSHKKENIQHFKKH